MIVCIAGLLNEWGGSDLSPYIDRQATFNVNAAIGARLDTLTFTLYDKLCTLVVPARAEIIVYDAPGIGQVGGVAQTWLRGSAPIVDPPVTPPFGSPSLWTPRLFGGYASSCGYTLNGAERSIVVHAQDYTIRNKTTVVNKAYAPGDVGHSLGWTDDQIIKDLFAAYRPDIDTANVTTAFTTPGTVMPIISFPTHTLEQFFQRVLKVTQGWFRIDYYKRLFYGGVGSGPGSYAPFALSDTPSPVLPANLLPSGDFETGAENWSVFNAQGAAPVQTNAQAANGSRSLQLTGNAASATTSIQAFSTALIGATTQCVPGGVGTVPAIPGSAYLGMVSVRSASTPRGFTACLVFADAAGNRLAMLGPNKGTTSTTSGWTQLLCVAKAPVAAAWVYLGVISAAGGLYGAYDAIPNAEAHYLDMAGVFAVANLLTANQSSFDSDVGGWLANTNAGLMQSSAQSTSGGESMAMTSVAAGAMRATSEAGPGPSRIPA